MVSPRNVDKKRLRDTQELEEKHKLTIANWTQSPHYHALIDLGFTPDHIAVMAKSYNSVPYRFVEAVNVVIKLGFIPQGIATIINAGGLTALGEIEYHFVGLTELGYTSNHIVTLVNCCPANYISLLALKYDYACLIEFGFSPDNIVAMAMLPIGTSKLDAVKSHFVKLKGFGFTPADVIKIVSSTGGVVALSIIAERHRDLHNLGLVPAQITEIVCDYGYVRLNNITNNMLALKELKLPRVTLAKLLCHHPRFSELLVAAENGPIPLRYFGHVDEAIENQVTMANDSDTVPEEPPIALDEMEFSASQTGNDPANKDIVNEIEEFVDATQQQSEADRMAIDEDDVPIRAGILQKRKAQTPVNEARPATKKSSRSSVSSLELKGVDWSLSSPRPSHAEEDMISIKQEPTALPKIGRIHDNVYIKIEDESSDLSQDPQLLPLPANFSFDLTQDTEVGFIEELSLAEVTQTAQKYDINKPEDIQRLVEVDKLQAYLSHPTIQPPPVEIKELYAIPGAKGVFALKNITHLNQPLGDYLGEPGEHPGSAYVIATAAGSIDALYKRDWTAYMNHSTNPNVRIEEREDGMVRFYPMRPIKAGEQMTFDYGENYFKVLGFNPYYLHKHDDEMIDAEKVLRNKSAYHPTIIAWTSAALQTFFAGGALPHEEPVYYIVPKMLMAILNEDIAYVKVLLQKFPPDLCAYAVQKTADGFKLLPPSYQEHITPLMLAAHCGQIEIIKLLIEAGADLNRQMFKSGHSPLSLIMDGNDEKAALADYLINENHEKIELFAYLLEKNAKVLNFLLQTPLKNQTVQVINHFLYPPHVREQIRIKQALHAALYTISLPLFKTAPREVVTAIWNALTDKSHRDMVTPLKMTSIKMKALKKAYAATPTALHKSNLAFFSSSQPQERSESMIKAIVIPKGI